MCLLNPWIKNIFLQSEQKQPKIPSPDNLNNKKKILEIEYDLGHYISYSFAP